MQIWESHYVSKLTEYRMYQRKMREMKEKNQRKF